MRRGAWVLFALAAGCDAPSSTNTSNDSKIIGMTAERAIDALGLTVTDYVVDGPGFRGAKGRDAKGEEIWLQVAWEGTQLMERSAIERSPFIRSLKVIGLARRTGQRWVTVGRLAHVFDR